MLRPSTFLFACLLVACSADRAPEPEPTWDLPGAFVAVEQEPGQVEVYRTLFTLEDVENTVIFSLFYLPSVASFEEAETYARERRFVAREDVHLYAQSLLSERPSRVAWYRSLTEGERALGR